MSTTEFGVLSRLSDFLKGLEELAVSLTIEIRIRRRSASTFANSSLIDIDNHLLYLEYEITEIKFSSGNSFLFISIRKSSADYYIKRGIIFYSMFHSLSRFDTYIMTSAQIFPFFSLVISVLNPIEIFSSNTEYALFLGEESVAGKFVTDIWVEPSDFLVLNYNNINRLDVIDIMNSKRVNYKELNETLIILVACGHYSRSVFYGYDPIDELNQVSESACRDVDLDEYYKKLAKIRILL